MTVTLDGPGLDGAAKDRRLIQRIGLKRDAATPCDTTYHYGWDVILGEKPFVERREQ